MKSFDVLSEYNQIRKKWYLKNNNNKINVSKIHNIKDNLILVLKYIIYILVIYTASYIVKKYTFRDQNKNQYIVIVFDTISIKQMNDIHVV